MYYVNWNLINTTARQNISDFDTVFWAEIEKQICYMIYKYYKIHRPKGYQSILSNHFSVPEDPNYSDLVYSAYVQVIIALRKYQPEKGAFVSYAWNYMRNGIHSAYCKLYLKLTPYYAKKRKLIFDYKQSCIEKQQTCSLEDARIALNISRLTVRRLSENGSLNSF